MLLAQSDSLFASDKATLNERIENADLKTQVNDDRNSLLPQGEKYSLFGEGYLFKNSWKAFYHGGYWYNIFLESTHIPRTTINANN